ncbi:mannitol dehydrogenase family protein [Thalassococcus lentus]|uniref:Mannitol dehydrogenase family protein n=1 Tax=Thalassococcus lentus TaxID=1210524 RepID=A0ABT4XQ86_9RHOB|nr:mannitol dehydrogenase family protein [Thalassococcus lentus]MDA7424018.1 mannitol dehydrogenase family protein [Thalassococcus lentus]
MKLSDSALSRLPDAIECPRYDRSRLRPGIVHIGLGNFHRAHQAWYLHRLMQKGQALDWAIIGAGVRPYDAKMRDKLLEQDCLTTLIELDPKGTRAEVIGSMIDYLPIEEGNGPLIAQMADASIRIVALTVTEGGYFLDAATGDFDADHEDIRHDAQNPEQPRTVFGAIVAALRLRRANGLPPFTALSCDNLQGNGEILRSCVVGLASMTDPELAEWIDSTGAFPNSMVDCIVPATSDELIELAQDMGIEDAAPVSHESFRQWVLEDVFCNGRPAWEAVGATITGDVHSYETMKIRVLNGGHQVLANAGEILSLDTIADCMQDEQLPAFFRKIQQDGILPYVSAVPEMDPSDYLTLIEERFANPRIHDSVRRVAFDGSSRHTGFILPVLRDAIASGASVQALALVEALWARMCTGLREDGSEIEPNDPNWDALQAAALKAKTNPVVWLEQSEIYGALVQEEAFVAAFGGWLTKLHDQGCRATLSEYLS